MKHELSVNNRLLFKSLIRQVVEGIEKGVRAGIALKRIRDEQLWKEDYESFEQFCFQVFGFKQAHAYRLIEWSELKNSPIGEKLKNEAQGRALAKVSEEMREEVLEEAASQGEVTAASITEAAKKVEKTIHLDKTGYPIPEEILEEWRRAESVGKDLLKKSSEIKCVLVTGNEDDDPIFREVYNSAATHASNVYISVKQIVPFAVCTSCQGKLRKKCALCKGRGFFSEFMFKTAIPEEVKNLRRKGGVK